MEIWHRVPCKDRDYTFYKTTYLNVTRRKLINLTTWNYTGKSSHVFAYLWVITIIFKNHDFSRYIFILDIVDFEKSVFQKPCIPTITWPSLSISFHLCIYTHTYSTKKSYVLTIHMSLYVCIIFRPKAKNDDRSYENNADVDINVLDDYDMFQLKCLIIS